MEVNTRFAGVSLKLPRQSKCMEQIVLLLQQARESARMPLLHSLEIPFAPEPWENSATRRNMLCNKESGHQPELNYKLELAWGREIFRDFVLCLQFLVFFFFRAKMPQRMRMRPWLEMQINSNKIPGLHWLDKKEKRFQIPWKHAAKHGWELEKDACLFKNWAVHTGRYKDGDVDPDPKTWKANFRCAMNSLPDIQEVKDQSISRGPGAVRVYKMLKPTVKLEKKAYVKHACELLEGHRFMGICRAEVKTCKVTGPTSTDDIKEEETVEATNSIQLADDHSGYALPSCAAEDMEVGSTFGLQCELNSDAWRNYPLDVQAPDSTDNMYRLQVSPCYSSSEDEDIPLYDMFTSSEWHQSSIGGRGFLLNEGKVFNLSEAAMQNLSLDFTLQEQDTGFDIPKLEVIPHDSKSSAEYTLLDIRHFVPPISCGI
ncbi:hypothetical protein Chor_011841 [Crotalus horridus]